MTVMMMGRMMPPPQMNEVLSEASEPSFAEVDLDEKRHKADVIDEIDASSHVEHETVEEDMDDDGVSEDGESMRF